VTEVGIGSKWGGRGKSGFTLRSNGVHALHLSFAQLRVRVRERESESREREQRLKRSIRIAFSFLHTHTYICMPVGVHLAARMSAPHALLMEFNK
jgi:hypothetical protein